MPAPQEFALRLQKGITGGFAPPTPDYIFTVSKASSFSPSDNPRLAITRAIRQDGTPAINESEAMPSFVAFDEPRSSLIDQLYDILQGLPTGIPPGMGGAPTPDFYGFDTGIMWGSDELVWQNSAPQGCGQGGFGAPEASGEEKRRFKEAVELIHRLVGYDAANHQLMG